MPNILASLNNQALTERDEIGRQLQAWTESRSPRFDGTCDWRAVNPPTTFDDLMGRIDPRSGPLSEFDQIRLAVIAATRPADRSEVWPRLERLTTARAALLAEVRELCWALQAGDVRRLPDIVNMESVRALNDACISIRDLIGWFETDGEPALAVDHDPPEKPGHASTNALMITTLGKNPDAQDWTITDWESAINRSRGSIHKTNAWKSIQQLRESNRQLRLERQNAPRSLRKK